jgi:hypothetical protein
VWCAGTVPVTDPEYCEPWTLAVLDDQPCPYEVRWTEGACECRARGWNAGVEACVETGGHSSRWIHDGKHLVCEVCDLEGT